ESVAGGDVFVVPGRPDPDHHRAHRLSRRSSCNVFSKAGMDLRVMNPYKVVFLVILSIVLLLPMVTRAQQAPDADAVAPVFTPADYGGTSYTGYVADRMDVNLVKRLLAIDVDALLLPYTNRPGAQEWLGDHSGSVMHAGINSHRLT